MTKRMVLAGLLALAAVPALAADTTADRKATAAPAAQIAQSQVATAPAHACTCSHGS